MPSRNIVKEYDSDVYYHAYNRGVEKRKIFLDDEDYAVFENLFKRYLDSKPTKDNYGREYDWLAHDIELVAFCLMPTHFHLLIYQMEQTAMTRLMRAVCSSYTTYFNKKYDRVGKLFQGHFKASIIHGEPYLLHISRYIHCNPTDYRSWKWSSLSYWVHDRQASWVHPERLNDMTKAQYMSFLHDSNESSTDEISSLLADE